MKGFGIWWLASPVHRLDQISHCKCMCCLPVSLVIHLAYLHIYVCHTECCHKIFNNVKFHSKGLTSLSRIPHVFVMPDPISKAQLPIARVLSHSWPTRQSYAANRYSVQKVQIVSLIICVLHTLGQTRCSPNICIPNPELNHREEITQHSQEHLLFSPCTETKNLRSAHSNLQWNF